MTEGATIRYTIDGSLPNSRLGQIYTSELEIESDEFVITAVACKEGMKDSMVAAYNNMRAPPPPPPPISMM
jgi:hypothetical protein